ncbi:MAG: branched-chain-amino-acid transaminase [Phycisphaerales bacterium]|nr:branched-chain-amino-acid transaminase [Phycisphaerales bacterium]
MARSIWMNGTLVDPNDAKVSVFDHGLLYGDGCFEGIRVYGGHVFKLQAHVERMQASARRIHLEPPYSDSELAAAIEETVQANRIEDGYVRVVYTRGKGSLGLSPFSCTEPACIIIADTITLYPEEMYTQGMPVVIAQRPRIPIECLDPQIKSLNYLNNILAKVEAIDAGVHEAIMLNTQGKVAECTGDNIFLVKDGEIITPDTAAGMLHGITRQFVMEEVAPACGYTVTEREVERDELFTADEIFLTGTAAEVIGVSSIDGTPIGSGVVGPITRQLTEQFRGMVTSLSASPVEQ